jgi:hypothetical protein
MIITYFLKKKSCLFHTSPTTGSQSSPVGPKFQVKNLYSSWTLLAHIYNPSHSGRWQFKASPGKQSVRPYLEKTFTKQGRWNSLSSNSGTAKKKPKKLF